MRFTTFELRLFFATCFICTCALFFPIEAQALEVKGITADVNYKIQALPGCGEIRSWHGDFTDIDGNGRRDMHRGLDIVAPKGAEIIAPAPGKVIYKDKQHAGGNSLMIYHGADKYGNHVISYYAHLQEFKVEKDGMVKRGEPIGTLGDTGNNMPKSRTAHLHFEVLIYPDAEFKYWFTGFLRGFTTVSPNYFFYPLESTEVRKKGFFPTLSDASGVYEDIAQGLKFLGFTYPLLCF